MINLPDNSIYSNAVNNDKLHIKTEEFLKIYEKKLKKINEYQRDFVEIINYANQKIDLLKQGHLNRIKVIKDYHSEISEKIIPFPAKLIIGIEEDINKLNSAKKGLIEIQRKSLEGLEKHKEVMNLVKPLMDDYENFNKFRTTKQFKKLSKKIKASSEEEIEVLAVSDVYFLENLLDEVKITKPQIDKNKYRELWNKLNEMELELDAEIKHILVSSTNRFSSECASFIEEIKSKSNSVKIEDVKYLKNLHLEAGGRLIKLSERGKNATHASFKNLQNKHMEMHDMLCELLNQKKRYVYLDSQSIRRSEFY